MNVADDRVLLKDLNEIVVVDTSTFINIENNRFTASANGAIFKALDTNLGLFISDLTVSELILGCRNVEDLRKHLSEFIECGYNAFGLCEDLKKVIDQDSVERVIDAKALNEYKDTIKTVRNKYCFPYYQNMFITYSIIVLSILCIKNKNFWNSAYKILMDIFKNNTDVINNILKSTFCEFIDSKKDSRGLIQESFYGLLIGVLPNLGSEYDKESIDMELKQLNTTRDYKLLLDVLKIKNIKNPYVPLLKYLNSLNTLDSLIGEISKDAINYCVLKMVIANAKFNSHDLIDIYNIANIGSSECIIHYFTDDAFWTEFISVERMFNPNSKNLYIYLINKKIL